MKLGRILAVAFALMLIAAPSFAAVSFTSASTLNLIAPNARTGLAGNVTLTVIAPSATAFAPQGETLIDSFQGAQISTLATICVKATAEGSAIGAQTTFGFGSTVACTAAGVPPANIVNAAGVVAYGTTYTFSTFGVAVNPSVTVVFNPTNVTIGFPTGPVFFGQNSPAVADGIQFTGVRLNVVPVTNGTALGGTINATLTSVLSQISTTNPNLPVASIQDPITLTGPGSVTNPEVAFSTGAIQVVPAPPAPASDIVYVTEAGSFSNAFETNGSVNPVDSTQLIFNFASLPTGVTVTAASPGPAPILLPGQNLAGASPNSVAGGVVVGARNQTCGLPTNNTAAGTATVICYINAQDPAVLETFPVIFTFAASTTAGAVGQHGTVTVTLGPEAAAASIQADTLNLSLTGSGLTFGTNVAPLRYKRNDEPTVNVVTVVQLTTELLSPFNVSIPGAGGFDTGFAINNATGYLGIVAQSDVITITFQPYDGTTPTVVTTSATYPTAARRGLGLDTNGKVAAGGTWIALLSDLLADASLPATFRGAIRFTCKFTNGHGINYIADRNFAVQAQGYNMLVLGNANGNGTARPFALESIGQ